MEMIKVLQVNKLYFPATGGIEHVVRQLAEGLQKDTKTEVLVCQKKRKRSGGSAEWSQSSPCFQLRSLLLYAYFIFLSLEIPQAGEG